MSDLVEFLLLRLPEDEWDQLDEHRETRLAYEYSPPERGDLWSNHLPGCAACSHNPSKDGSLPYGTHWIESLPCRHLCRLALRYGDDPDFNVGWLERLTFGAQPF
jgi:hypothetical protein